MKRLTFLILILLLSLLAACDTSKTPVVETTEVDLSASDLEQSITQAATDSTGDSAEADATDIPGDDLQIETPYTVLMIGPYDGTGMVESVEYVIKEYNKYSDSSISKEEKVSAAEFGEIFEFSYKETYEESFSGLVTHTYVADNGVTVKFDKAKENIVFYDITYIYTPKVEEPKLLESECLLIAQDYLASITAYADQYVCTSVYDYDGEKQGGPAYIFLLTRFLDNYRTYDDIIVNVSKTGDITCYNKTSFGCADGITLPSEQEYAQMQASAIKAMEKMYEGRKYTYELRDVYISRDAQGKLAVEFLIDMDVWPQNADEDATPWAELCHLLIYPEDLAAEKAQDNSQ